MCENFGLRRKFSTLYLIINQVKNNRAPKSFAKNLVFLRKFKFSAENAKNFTRWRGMRNDAKRRWHGKLEISVHLVTKIMLLHIKNLNFRFVNLYPKFYL